MKLKKCRVGKAVHATLVAAALSIAPTAASLAEGLPYGLKADKPYDGETVTYLAPVAAQYQGHEERVTEFTEMTGINVEFEFVPFKTLQEKILSIKVAGDGDPDLINYLDAWGPAIKDMLIPLDDNLTEADVSMDRYFGAHKAGATYDGTVYGLPLRGHAQLLFYRKDLLEKHKLQVPNTWNDFVDVAKVIKDKEGIGAGGYYSPKTGQNIAVWANMLWGNGGELIKDGKAAFNSPEGVEALKYYVELETVHNINSPGAKSRDQYEGSLSVGAGNSAFYMGWWWHYGSRILGKNTTLTPEQIGFTGMPAFKGDKSVTFAISMPTGINVNSDEKGAAWEFLKWVSNPELEKRNVTEKENRNEIVAVHRENLLDAEVNAANRNIHAAAAASLDGSRIWPQLAAWPEIMQIIANAISDVVSNGADPQESLDEAAVAAQKLIDQG